MEKFIPLVWPVVVIFALLLFRRPIERLIDRIRKVSVDLKNSKAELSAESSTDVPEIAKKTITGETEIAGLTTAILAPSRKKVLATLWIFQKRHFGSDFDKRWTFTIGIRRPEYNIFSTAVGELAALGFVDQVFETGQVYLTNAGIDFCQRNADKLKDDEDHFTDFSN